MLSSRVTLPVILIGPVNAGKSTIAVLLAERLGVSHVSLDEVCWDYFEDAGYDEDVAGEHFDRGGQKGGTHQARDAPVPQRHLAPALPDPDESLRMLKARQSKPYPEIVEMNAHFVRHRSNYELATVVVYTKGKAPDETCEDIVARLV